MIELKETYLVIISALIIILGAIFAFNIEVKATDDAFNTSTSSNSKNTVKNSNSKKLEKSVAQKPIQIKNKKPNVSKKWSTKTEKQRLQAEYSSALKAIDNIVKKNNLDINKILNQSLNTDFESALEDLSPSEKIVFENFRKATIKLQDLELKKDNMSRSQMSKFKIKKPLWVSEREKELEMTDLNSDVTHYVSLLAEQPSISNQDVISIIDKCNDSKDCAEKAFFQLMNRNHILSHEQLEIIDNSQLI